MDGVTVGHPCCSVHECMIPLASKRKRFCPTHADMELLCRVKGCTNLADAKFRSCPVPEHRALDLTNGERGKSIFQLKKRLERARVSHPSNAVALDDAAEEAINSDGEDCSTKPDTGNSKVRAQWNRKQTHGEQLLVRPCGTIVAHATFQGSEGQKLVLVSNTLNSRSRCLKESCFCRIFSSIPSSLRRSCPP